MKILLTLLMISSLSFAQSENGKSELSFSTGGGNGGFIDGLIRAELMDREILNEDEIDQLVSDLGEEVKNEILKPLFTRLLAEDLGNLDDVQREIALKLKANQEKLFIDIKLSHIVLGNCNGATTCTDNKIYSDIVIDKKEVLETTYGTSISELIGLLAHEFVHHFFSEIPQHDSYPIAKLFKKYVLNGEYRFGEVVRINIKEMVRGLFILKGTEIVLDDDLKAVFASKREQLSRNANLFCEYNGYLRAVDFQGETLSYNDALSLGVHFDKNNFRTWTISKRITGDFHWDNDIENIRRTDYYVFKFIDCEKK